MSDLVRDAIHAILSRRSFTDADTSSGGRVRFYSVGGGGGGDEDDDDEEEEEEEERAALVVRGMGDWGRYGIQPLGISYDREIAADNADKDGAGSEWERSTAFHTLSGGHFDGEILVRAVGGGTSRDGGARTATLSVGLAVPRGGRVPSHNASTNRRIVSSLIDSIHRSILSEIRRSYARQAQSRGYRGRMGSRANVKRSVRYETERKMEEMADDRRRRGHNRDPDAGRYRPSGRRMRSPNNCR